MMHEQDLAIVKALVSVAWCDGVFAQKETELLEGLLDAFHASDEEKASVRDYAKEKRTLDDINVQELSASDRRLLLQHASFLTYVDGQQTDGERAFLEALAHKLRISHEETLAITASAKERAKNLVELL